MAVNYKLDTDTQVLFYEQEFYPLSNFSSFALLWKGYRFDTSEAAYHWEKFPESPTIQDEIRYATSAHNAFKVANAYKALYRPDWDEIKVGVMRDILYEKVAQHPYVLKKLLETGERALIEDSWRDDFWGWGEDHNGKNTLGNLWMDIRSEILIHNGIVPIKNLRKQVS